MMYCHWRPLDAVPLPTSNVFWGPQETSDLISMVVFTFALRRHLIWIASGPFTSFRLAKFGWVPFADLRVQCLAVKQNSQRVRENLGPILTHLWTKVYEISGQCRRPHVVVKADYVYRVPFGRYRPWNLPLICWVIKKVVLGPRFVRRWYTPAFGHAFSNRTHFWDGGQCWLSSIQRAPRVTDEKRRNNEIRKNPW